jgi:hypothetical protein
MMLMIPRITVYLHVHMYMHMYVYNINIHLYLQVKIRISFRKMAYFKPRRMVSNGELALRLKTVFRQNFGLGIPTF